MGPRPSWAEVVVAQRCELVETLLFQELVAVVRQFYLFKLDNWFSPGLAPDKEFLALSPGHCRGLIHLVARLPGNFFPAWSAGCPIFPPYGPG
jgi:hypothetical protein